MYMYQGNLLKGPRERKIFSRIMSELPLRWAVGIDFEYGCRLPAHQSPQPLSIKSHLTEFSRVAILVP